MVLEHWEMLRDARNAFRRSHPQSAAPYMHLRTLIYDLQEDILAAGNFPAFRSLRSVWLDTYAGTSAAVDAKDAMLTWAVDHIDDILNATAPDCETC